MEQQRELNGEAVEHNEQADEPAVKDNFRDLPLSKLLSLDVAESARHFNIVEKSRAGTGAAQSGDFSFGSNRVLSNSLFVCVKVRGPRGRHQTVTVRFPS